MSLSHSSDDDANDYKEGRDEIEYSVDEKAVLRKIDLRVIPWLALLYLLNFLDRGSIGNAKLYNLEGDIGITDRQYLIALTVFFFPYSLLEPASNVILRRIRPSIWLSSMMFVWGLVMTFHGFITNYGGLITVRVLLGAAEAGMYPGIVYFITSWYKRSEMGARVAIFFSSATIAGAFSGLLAAAISNMDGVGGKTGWQWIFILEGLATIIIAVISYWVIPDFPSSPRVKFLTEEERLFVIRRLEDDMKLSAAGESLKKAYIWQSLTDWKTWIAMGIYMGFDGPLYAFSLFTPTIINQVCSSTVFTHHPSEDILLACSLFGVGLVAYIILIASRSPALSYFAVYLAVSAIYPTIPNSVAWVASNVEGSYKRGVTLGMAIGFGNINGAVTANIYRSQDKPWYRLGHAIVLAYIAAGFLCSVLFAILLKRENARRDRGERDEVIEGVDNKRAHERNGTFQSVEEAKIAKGDTWSGFRYTL
ncbi:hypothetical protein CVT26_009929 [Gymnopilus dilepis]|uniref:Major facilitator superfamily (MFS) profile domain-containing protein n=1 Tax=Gymnopilus dilepis TaxID=231916 RepID=A0A409VL91_9AGAR|nr:hypothetical protein CVT26_009929 [Gymnopilus dilepis]